MATFRMTQEQFDKIIKASQPVPYIVAGGQEPSSPQENANRAWQDLGREMGFDWKTVRPTSDVMEFTADTAAPKATQRPQKP